MTEEEASLWAILKEEEDGKSLIKCWRGGVRTPIVKAMTATSAANDNDDDEGFVFVLVALDLDLPFSFFGFLVLFLAAFAILPIC